MNEQQAKKTYILSMTDKIKCEVCGKEFNPADLTQVLAHLVHKPVKELGIIGENVKEKP